MIKKYKIAKILILIPYMILITEILLLGLSLFCAYFNIHFSLVFFSFYFYLMFFATYPCLICSVVGFVLIIFFMKIGKLKSKKLILLSIISILISIVLCLWNTWHVSAMMSV